MAIVQLPRCCNSLQEYFLYVSCVQLRMLSTLSACNSAYAHTPTPALTQYLHSSKLHESALYTFKLNALPYPKSRNTEQLVTFPDFVSIDAFTCPTIVPLPSDSFV